MPSAYTILLDQDDVADQFLDHVEDSVLDDEFEPLERYALLLDVCHSLADSFSEVAPPLQEYLLITEGVEDSYVPSYPPMSPVTTSFFNYWTVSDLLFGPAQETLIGLIRALIKTADLDEEDELVLKMVEALADSSPRIYEVRRPGQEVVLEDICSGVLYKCRAMPTAEPEQGELWLTRLLPNFWEGSPFVLASTPYILTGNKKQWLEDLRTEASKREDENLDAFLKFGHHEFSWLEYIHQAYMNFRDDAVLLTGNLHDPSTRPHSEGRNLEPFEIPDTTTEIDIPVSLTQGQRKLISEYLPQLSARMEAKKSGRRDINLSFGEMMRVVAVARQLAQRSSGSELRVARELANHLEELMESAAEALGQFLSENEEDVPEFNFPWVEESEDILLRCTLEEALEPVIRWVKVPTDYALGELHHVLQLAFGWENCHLYDFQFGEETYCHPDAPLEGGESDEISLEEIFVQFSGGTYRYDFGDGWAISIQVLRGYDWGNDLPTIVAATGPSLVEDCGGVTGFQELLDVLRNPKAKDPRELRKWVNEDYDPWKPDLDECQRMLREFFLNDPDQIQVEYLVKRYRTQGINVAGEATDVLLIVDKDSGYVIEGTPILRSEGEDRLLELIKTGLKKAPKPDALAVEEESLARLLRKHLSLKVRVRRSLPELDVAAQEMEASLMDFPFSYEHLSHKATEEFLTAVNEYYLNPPWTEVSDQELFVVEGLTPEPLVLNVLGNAGVQYGLAVFEELEEAEAIFQEDAERPEKYFFLSFLENWEGAPLRKELHSLGLHPLPDMVPFVLSKASVSQERNFRMVTESLRLIHSFDRGGKKTQTFPGPAGAGEVKVTWPVSPDGLREFKKKKKAKPNTKLGRNDPCWCGSGKKYKKCHLGKD